NSGLTEEEIQKMVRDAEANAAEDRRMKEVAEAHNQGDALVHSTKKALSEHGEKLEAEERGRIEAAVRELEAALKGNDKADIDAKAAALSSAAQKLGEKMYADMQAQQAASDAAAGAEARETPPDDVVDAEFKEVKRK
ncbi:MAG TPA: Hsp70 family protein, partial [Burkholderiaceae bacterium]|nr:Hsp70 family protein [Burkholderiaceae bacterium]